MAAAVQEIDTESALYAGAIATAVIALLPYINDFVVPCYVIGAAVAVWFAISKQGQSLTPKACAKLGFLSSFFGSMAAVVLVDIIWQFFDYQLWQKQNAQFMVAIFRLFASEETVSAVADAMAQNASKSFAWYFVIFQLIGNVIMAGIFGTLAGLITRKVVAKPSRTAV